MTLKELGDGFIPPPFWDDWRQSFQDFVENTLQPRIEELADRPLDISNEDDYKMLTGLLARPKYGGAANAGQTMGFEKADDVIRNADFRDLLQQYMKNPDNSRYFFKMSCKSKEITKKDYKVTMNRIAALCTHTVSAGCDEGGFDKAVLFLQSNGIIKDGSVSRTGRLTDWFTKNQKLMKIIEDEIGDSLDRYKKAILPWGVYLYCEEGKGDLQLAGKICKRGDFYNCKYQ